MTKFIAEVRESVRKTLANLTQCESLARRRTAEVNSLTVVISEKTHEQITRIRAVRFKLRRDAKPILDALDSIALTPARREIVALAKALQAGTRVLLFRRRS
jgi:hypothetical protein